MQTLDAGIPLVLFKGRYSEHETRGTGIQLYDVSSEGRRFVMIRESDQPPTQLNVALNGFEELKRLSSRN